jgi:hypothetical protein
MGLTSACCVGGVRRSPTSTQRDGLGVCSQREALLGELRSAEAVAHLQPLNAKPNMKVNSHIQKHAALKACLHMTMPAAAEAYEDALASKLSGNVLG